MLAAIQKSANQLVSFFIPPQVSEGRHQKLRQARLLIALSLSMWVWTPLFAALFVFGFREPLPARLIGIFTLLSTFSPWILKKTGSIQLSSAWFCLDAFTCVLFVSALAGGFGAPTTIWLATIPMIAAILGGRRAGFFWAAAAGAASVGFYALDQEGVALFQIFTPAQRRILEVVSLISSSLVMLTTGLLSERESDVALTRLEESNRALAEARDQAQAASQAKGDFVAMVSHEIRNPMNGVIGTTALLLETPLNDEQTDLTRTIKSSGETLLDLLNDVLDLSKIESGRLEFEVVEFSLAAALEEAIDPIRARARSRGIALNLSMGPGVPAGIVGDPARLKQVLINLINNAVKFTHQGQVSVQVHCRSRQGDQAVLNFEVEDTGIGIDPAVREQLFQVFKQADSATTRKYGGTGLGLAISKKIVEQMGGQIGLESEPGWGSTFWFDVPVEICEIQKAPEPEPVVKLAPRVSSGAFRILVAEDNPINQKLIARMLSRLGYQFDLAANGREAADAFARSPYHMVLMDCHMPEMDGFAATGAIRSLEGSGLHTPIIAVTANAMPGDRERCLAAGMDDYLPKPITLEALSSAIDRWSDLRAAS